MIRSGHLCKIRVGLPRLTTRISRAMTYSNDSGGKPQDEDAARAARAAHEKSIKRNPHPDFEKVQASRPDFVADKSGFTYTKTPAPGWKYGDGANDLEASTAKTQSRHISIDPYEEGRPAVYNYKLLISSIVPRPIGFLSTLSKDGKSANLAPFSYTNMVNHDPPLFTVGFAGGGIDNAKDTLRNLVDTKEAVLNIISEHFAEAANSTSINAPFEVSEWDVSGLTQESCSHVKPARVGESIFSVECRLHSVQEFESKNPQTPGKKTGVLAILEGVNFWVREDAINEEKNIIDPAVLKPLSRLGGITYGRTTDGFEILRPNYDEGVVSALEKLAEENSKTT